MSKIMTIPGDTGATRKILRLIKGLLNHECLPSAMFGGSSTIVLEMLSVWMNISPACEVNMWDSTLAPDRFDIGISNMTDRSFNRKLVKHEECRLEIKSFWRVDI